MGSVTEQQVLDHYNKHYDRLVNAAKSNISGSVSDAEEIVQEAVLTMVAQAKTGKLEGQKGMIAGWHQVLGSRATDIARANQRWKRNTQAGVDAGQEMSITASPQARLMHNEDTKVLSAVVPAMIAKESNERAQEVLTYVYLKGFSQIEAAEAAGMSYRHAKRLLEAFRKRVSDDSLT